MIKITKNNQELWARLFDLADEVKALKPWTYLTEDKIFAIEDYQTEKLYFFSAMGTSGEELGVNIYKGWEAIDNLFEIRNLLELNAPPSVFLEYQTCLMLSYEDVDFLEKHDKYLIKQLKRRYRGRKDWTRFLDMTPGFVPWIITEEQANILVRILPRAIDVLKQAKENQMLMIGEFNNQSEDAYLSYKLRQGEWIEDWITFPEKLMEAEEPAPLIIDDTYLTAAKVTGKRHEGVWACVEGLLPLAVQEKPSIRPHYSYITLWINTSDGTILGMNMFEKVPTAEELQKSAEEIFTKHGIPEAVGFVEEPTLFKMNAAIEAAGSESAFSDENYAQAKGIIYELVEQTQMFQ